MSLKQRLGFSPFRKAAEPGPDLITDAISEFHTEYAEFCGTINPHSSATWRARGFADFPKIFAVDGVAHMGISQGIQPQLHIATTCIIVPDQYKKLRRIGEIIVTFNPKTKTVTYENVTSTLRNKESTSFYAHPHILNGTLCSTGRDAILEMMLNADVSSAMRKIMQNLRMRSAEVTIGNAYCPVANWPAIE